MVFGSRSDVFNKEMLKWGFRAGSLTVWLSAKNYSSLLTGEVPTA